MGHDGWMLDEALDAPRLSARRRSGSARDRRAPRAALEHHREHAARSLASGAARAHAGDGLRGLGIDPLDLGVALQPLRDRQRVLAVCRSMRSARVFSPRMTRKLSKGLAIAPIALCRNASRSAKGPFAVTTMPPTMSEWPLRYLVAECTTRSKPSSIGRCARAWRRYCPRRSASRARAATSCDHSEIDEFEQWITRRLHPDHPGIRADRPLERPASGKGVKVKSSPAERRRTPSKSRSCRRKDHRAPRRARHCRAVRARWQWPLMPEANAKPSLPPSRSATQRS